MSTWQDLIQQLHESPHQLVLAVTGGGSLAISGLLTRPGASATVLEAVVPYSPQALDEWLGQTPESYCSRETALSMATTAWWRARHFSSGEAPRLGVGCTASLASDRPKRGEHRCWIAVESDRQSTLHSLVLAKGARDRAGEELLVRSLILRAIAESAGLGPGPMLDLAADETIVVDSETPPPEIADVRSGVSQKIWSIPGGGFSDEPPQPVAGLLSGAFYPLHRGHEELRVVAERLLGGPVAFEMPVVNADKPPLDFFSIEQRRSQFGNSPLAVSATPLFVDKTRLFPGTIFVVGFDTAARVLDPHFYGDSAENLAAALSAIREAGCGFLVAGRRDGQAFLELSQLNLPIGVDDLFSAIPEAEFREDISSTEIRKRGTRDAASV